MYTSYGHPLPFDDLDREVEAMMRAAQPVSSATDKTLKIVSFCITDAVNFALLELSHI